MSRFLKQASHNEDFHNCLCDNFDHKFYDWKITTVFYTAIHYLKALADKKGINIGQTHYDIENNINPKKYKPSMSLSKGAYNEYHTLLQYSRTARYEGIDTDEETYELIKKHDYENSLIHFDNFKKYLISKGLEI
ncbi:MAG: HEPN domain-containing protein [Bacteroidetes bacterium]|jgi:hypothetical protein|nr:HEPN domain-containing protein [Bacteroidota bacterium]